MPANIISSKASNGTSVLSDVLKSAVIVSERVKEKEICKKKLLFICKDIVDWK